jgi:DNA (cytosine-5)-methyltransferase 1
VSTKVRVEDRTSAPVAVDLFAGGGGLTVGLKAAGFKVVAAVENHDPARVTYSLNHPEVGYFGSDIRDVKGAALLGASPTGQIDLLAGCPPCQGFSSLTAKYSKRDSRNTLIREVGRLVRLTKPRAIMIENVPGLAMKGRRYLSDFITTLEGLGYEVEMGVLQVADYGVPQTRRRFVLLAGLGFHIPLPAPTRSKTGKDLPKWRAAREVLKGRAKAVTLSYSLERGGPAKFNWHIVRTMTDANVQRLKAARAGKSWKTIPKRLRPDCHKEGKTVFGNVYGRMRWAMPSPTITGGCTTLSKGRFGHPIANRTISVREAAAFQTFPETYKFPGTYMDHVCAIVGNALPCDFAKVLALHCKRFMDGHAAARD